MLFLVSRLTYRILYQYYFHRKFLIQIKVLRIKTLVGRIWEKLLCEPSHHIGSGYEPIKLVQLRFLHVIFSKSKTPRQLFCSDKTSAKFFKLLWRRLWNLLYHRLHRQLLWLPQSTPSSSPATTPTATPPPV